MATISDLMELFDTLNNANASELVYYYSLIYISFPEVISMALLAISTCEIYMKRLQSYLSHMVEGRSHTAIVSLACVYDV